MAYSNIDKPNQYFNTKLYTGTGASNSVDVGFQTDFTWIKDRDSGAAYHYLYDTVRGAGNAMYSNDTLSEATNINNLASFDASGFTVGTGGGVNASGNDFVSWNFLAGGTASSNTDGSITSQVSANTTSGFSIVSYTGTGANATVGHGLGVAPKMVIIKNRTTAAQNWQCYHSALGGTQAIELNTTSAAFTDSTRFNNTDPTSSVFSIGTSTDVNTSSASIIAYCFAEKKGFSKFGSYTGNGSTDGTFIYTGFKPAFFIVKKSSASGTNWKIFDNKRATTFNPTQTPFNANDSSAEDNNSAYELDFLSNGIKLRNTNGNISTSGATFIYMAFAESPLVGSNLVPNNAR